MSKLILATAAAAFLLGIAGATTGADAAKRLSVIPANCTIDPYKQVYVCCTIPEGGGDPVCTEHPLDTEWPLKQRFQKLRQFQTQPTTVQPGLSQ
jgi:hypothetical protein